MIALKNKTRFAVLTTVLILGASLAMLFPAHQAHAQDGPGGWITGIVGGAIGFVSFVLIYIITLIAGVVITVITYLVGVILELSTNVVNTLAVQRGFQVTLAVANLGFILAIIIIAIATILRRETYGIKKSLWKLVVAAILVNFSLVIGGAIIGFANTFTNAFLSQPGGGGTMMFASQLAGAFGPQRALLNFENAGTTNKTITYTGEITGGKPKTAESGADLSSIIQPLIGVFSAAAFLIVIVITLAVFLLMLLIRYIYLAILLVLMPFAWLMWLFPKTSYLWSKWWNQFFRWTFFAPLVVFFIWLAIATAQGMNPSIASGGSGSLTNDLDFLTGKTQYQASDSNPQLAGLSGPFGGFIGGFAGAVLQGVIVTGLALGGMMAANELGIKGASVAMGAAKSVGNAAKGFAAQQTKKAARLAYQKAGGERLTRSLQEGRMGAAIKKIPIVGGVAGGIIRRGESIAGRGLASISTNEELVEKAKKNVPENPEEIRRNLRGSMNKQDQFAHIAKLIQMGEFKEDDVINGRNAKDFLDSNKDALARFGQEKLSKDADKALGSNKDMRDAEREIKALSKEGKDASVAMAQLESATQAFVEKLQKADMSKMNVNDVFGKDTTLSRVLARSLAKYAPHLTSSAMPKMKSRALTNFASMYRSEIAAEQEKGPHARAVKFINANKTLTLDEKKRAIEKLSLTEDEAKLQAALESFENALGNNTLYFGGTEERPSAGELPRSGGSETKT